MASLTGGSAGRITSVVSQAKSDRKCPNENCQTSGQWTNLSVCHHCHQATVRSIYQPRTPITDWRRRRAASP